MSKIILSLIIAFGLSIFVPLFLLAGHQMWAHVTNDEDEIKDIVLTSLKERYGEDFTNIEYIDYVQPINKHKLEAQSVRTGLRFNVSLDNGDLRDEYGLNRDVRETVERHVSVDRYYLEVDSEVNLLSSSPGLENSDLSVHIIIAGTDRDVDSEKLVAVYQDLIKMRFKQFTLSFALFDEETQPFLKNMKETGYENNEQSHRQTASCSLTFPGGNVDASNVLNHCE